MISLAAIGFGYCARHLLAEDRAAFGRVIGTSRDVDRLSTFQPDVEAFAFNGRTLGDGLAAALGEVQILLASACLFFNPGLYLAVTVRVQSANLPICR